MKIIALIAAYNEEGVIEKCIENAREQGLDVLVIDNGCTDGTMEIVKKLDAPVYEYKTKQHLMPRLCAISVSRAKKIGCDWYVEKDADEMFETYDGRKVVEVVSEADSLGYNCMRFDLYEFWPTVDDDLSIKDFTDRIQYYSYFGNNQLKMFKNSPEIWTRNSYQAEGTIKESPAVKLIIRHYKFISLEQGREKVRARLRRRIASKGIGVQYQKFTDESKFYVLEKEVYRRLYKFNGTWVKKRVFDGWRGY